MPLRRNVIATGGGEENAVPRRRDAVPGYEAPRAPPPSTKSERDAGAARDVLQIRHHRRQERDPLPPPDRLGLALGVPGNERPRRAGSGPGRAQGAHQVIDLAAELRRIDEAVDA